MEEISKDEQLRIRQIDNGFLLKINGVASYLTENDVINYKTKKDTSKKNSEYGITTLTLRHLLS